MVQHLSLFKNIWSISALDLLKTQLRTTRTRLCLLSFVRLEIDSTIFKYKKVKVKYLVNFGVGLAWLISVLDLFNERKIKLKFLEEKDKEEYKNFLSNHERCNFQQSLE